MTISCSYVVILQELNLFFFHVPLFQFDNKGQLAKTLATLHLENEGEDATTLSNTRYPRRVDRNGNFVSYITLDDTLGADEQHSRRRRSAADHLDANEVAQDGNHELFLEMDNVFGMKKAQFHLKRNFKLVSRSFVVEVRGRSGKLISRDNAIDDCHYVGNIHNHDGFSKVALSLCEGVVSDKYDKT